MASPLIVPVFHWTNVNLASSVGYQLFSYFAGTLNLQATYTDASLSVANANPVILDAAGDASVWIGAGIYKFILKDNLGNTIWTQDNVSQGNLANSFGSEFSVFTTANATFASATTFTIPGDVRSSFPQRKMLRLNSFNINTVVGTSFGAGNTTVTVAPTAGSFYAAVPNPITLLEISVLDPTGGTSGTAGVLSLPKSTGINVATTPAVNIASNTLYTLGAASPWATSASLGDDFAEYSAGNFTVSQGGKYLCMANCSFAINGSTVTNPGQMTTYINGAAAQQSRVRFALGTGGTFMSCANALIANVNSGQIINFKLDNGPTISAGTAQSGECSMNVIRIW